MQNAAAHFICDEEMRLGHAIDRGTCAQTARCSGLLPRLPTVGQPADPRERVRWANGSEGPASSKGRQVTARWCCHSLSGSHPSARRYEFLIHFAHDRVAVSPASSDTDWAVVSIGSVVDRSKETTWAVWSVFGATSIVLTPMKELSIGTLRDHPVASTRIAADQTPGRGRHAARSTCRCMPPSDGFPPFSKTYGSGLRSGVRRSGSSGPGARRGRRERAFRSPQVHQRGQPVVP